MYIRTSVFVSFQTYPIFNICLLNVVVWKNCHDSVSLVFCYCNHLPNNVGKSWNKLRHLVKPLQIFELLSGQVPSTFHLVGAFQWLTLYSIERNIHTRSLLVWIPQLHFYCVCMSIYLCTVDPFLSLSWLWLYSQYYISMFNWVRFYMKCLQHDHRA